MTRLPSTLEVHDFRQPRQLMPTSWRTIQRWYSDGCRLVAERWQRLGLRVSLSHQQTRVLSLRSALAALPEPGFGVRGRVGVRATDTLLACPPTRVQSLVRQLLGDATDDSAETRTLTAVEESMAELLLAEFFQGMGDAWPGAEPLNSRLTDLVDQPHRTRMFPPRTTLIVTSLQIRSPSDESMTAPEMESGGGPASGEIVWVMPQEDIEDLIEIECDVPAPQATKPHPAIPTIMREVPVSVRVELGRMHLSMSELTSLETGDVVILEQSVRRPLNVYIGEAVKFRGRPGRIGSRRCFEIQQVLEEVTGSSPVSQLP